MKILGIGSYDWWTWKFFRFKIFHSIFLLWEKNFTNFFPLKFFYQEIFCRNNFSARLFGHNFFFGSKNGDNVPD